MQRTDSGLLQAGAAPIGSPAAKLQVSTRIPAPATPGRPPLGTAGMSRLSTHAMLPKVTPRRGDSQSQLGVSPGYPSPDSGTSDDAATLTNSSLLRSPSLKPPALPTMDSSPALRGLGGYSRDSASSLSGVQVAAAAGGIVSSRDDNCHVTVRMRPPNFSESTDKLVWTVEGEQKIRLDPIFADMNRRTHSEYVYGTFRPG